jgi:hypothetical protein
MQWSKNDELFIKNLETGNLFADKVVSMLRNDGFEAYAPQTIFRNNIKEVHKYKDEKDVIVKIKDNELILEVKSRNLYFTNKNNYPYDTAFIDTVSGWQAKSIKPFAVIVISQITNNIVIVRPSLCKLWNIENKKDRIRKINESFYTINKNLLEDYSYLVDGLKCLNS